MGDQPQSAAPRRRARGLVTAAILGVVALALVVGQVLPGGGSGDAAAGQPAAVAGKVAAAAPTAISAVAPTGTPSERAWQWITSMLASPTAVTSGSTITPSTTYAADWAGPVSGRFAPAGVTLPPVSQGIVVLSSTSAAAAGDPDYRGPVTGRVTLPAQAGRWIIQVYRGTPDGRVQAPRQALVAPDGTFTVDLAGLTPVTGRWEFGVLDATAGYAPTGEPWPGSATFQGWEVRVWATTDRPYLVASGAAGADGSFSIPVTAPGAKSFQLVDIGSAAPGSGAPGTVLAEWAPDTGLVRSFAPAPEGTPGATAVDARTHTYDQALALQAAVLQGDRSTAGRLLTGLLSLQTSAGAQRGAFTTSAPQWNPAGAEPLYRSGNTAVAVSALLSWIATAPPTEPRLPEARAAAQAGLDWLAARRVSSGPLAGLLTGGVGTVVDGTLDAAAALDWVSTEHNLDAWQAFSTASTVLLCSPCAAIADVLEAQVQAQLWVQAEHRFRQGATATGPDDVDALDVNTWGSVFLTEIGQPQAAAAAIAHAGAFAVSDGGVTGHMPFRAQPAMPNPVASVWFEGSFGVALAQFRSGDAAGGQATLAGLATAQRTDGSFPAATTTDPFTGYSPASSVAATAWFLLAGQAMSPGSIWN